MLEEVRYITKQEISKYESVSNGIDYDWFKPNIIRVQRNYIDRILGFELAQELQLLLYIEKLKPVITADVVSNVLTVTTHSGALITVGDELVSPFKAQTETKLEKLLYKENPTATDLADIAALELILQGLEKNNTKVTAILTGTGGVGTYSIEIEGNTTEIQNLASQSFYLINANERLRRKLAPTLITWLIYTSLDDLWAKMTAQGLVFAETDKVKSVDLSGVTYKKTTLEAQANIENKNLIDFLEFNYLKYPKYVLQADINSDCCIKPKTNYSNGIYFY